MKKLISVVIFCFIATGCGSTGEDNDASSKEKFIVGMECNYAPFNWQSTSPSETSVSLGGAGHCDGYDVRVAKEIAQKLNRELEVKKIAWDGLQPALDSGTIDAIIAGMTKDEKREHGIDFTTPYYESEMVMIVRKGDASQDFNSIQQFSAQTIVGQKNTNYDTVIDQIKGVKHATPKATYPEMILSLRSKEVDGITAELPVAQGVIESNTDLAIVTFEKTKGFDIDTTVSIGLKEGTINSPFSKEVQKALDSISSSTRDQWMEDARNNQPKINQ